MSTHPAHLTDSRGNLTPAAFVPFCAFQTVLLGQDRQDLPFIACDKFRPTVLEGQLCYSLDPALLNKKTKAGIEAGLLLVLDSGKSEASLNTRLNLDQTMKIRNINIKPLIEDGSTARIYLNTLARFTTTRNGSFAMSALKSMTGSQNFMNLPDDTKKCQVESYESCNVKGYLEAVKEQCGCVPWALSSALTGKVRLSVVKAC